MASAGEYPASAPGPRRSTPGRPSSQFSSITAELGNAVDEHQPPPVGQRRGFSDDDAQLRPGRGYQSASSYSRGRRIRLATRRAPPCRQARSTGPELGSFATSSAPCRRAPYILELLLCVSRLPLGEVKRDETNVITADRRAAMSLRFTLHKAIAPAVRNAAGLYNMSCAVASKTTLRESVEQ